MLEITFETEGMAHTLSPDEVCEDYGDQTGDHTRIHADGWAISGYIHEDYYTWVNDFQASHPTFGKVWGNFEHTVSADSYAGYAAFCAAHGPSVWDYMDI